MSDDQPIRQGDGLACPVKVGGSDCIQLAHGEGGRLMRRLIRDRIVPTLDNPALRQLDDAARVGQIEGPLLVTTDAFVVSPLFFPGGDIGSLAVYGTVNDLAVSGARPRFLTLSLIVQEGLPCDVLDKVLRSVAQAAARVGVAVVAGDTKVVPRGAADELFLSMCGIGQQIEPVPAGPSELNEADELIVSGPIGCHGMAVLCAREQLQLEPTPISDSQPLWPISESLQQALGTQLVAMRDATRGGLAAVLHEWAEASGKTLVVREADVPVTPEVRGACEMLGLDPMHVANEGTMVVAVRAGFAQAALECLRRHAPTAAAAAIGHVAPRAVAPVVIERATGLLQPLDEPLGAPLPRIC